MAALHRELISVHHQERWRQFKRAMFQNEPQLGRARKYLGRVELSQPGYPRVGDSAARLRDLSERTYHLLLTTQDAPLLFLGQGIRKGAQAIERFLVVQIANRGVPLLELF